MKPVKSACLIGEEPTLMSELERTTSFESSSLLPNFLNLKDYQAFNDLVKKTVDEILGTGTFDQDPRWAQAARFSFRELSTKFTFPIINVEAKEKVALFIQKNWADKEVHCSVIMEWIFSTRKTYDDIILPWHWDEWFDEIFKQFRVEVWEDQRKLWSAKRKFHQLNDWESSPLAQTQKEIEDLKGDLKVLNFKTSQLTPSSVSKSARLHYHWIISFTFSDSGFGCHVNLLREILKVIL